MVKVGDIVVAQGDDSAYIGIIDEIDPGNFFPYTLTVMRVLKGDDRSNWVLRKCEVTLA